jgi:competence protein ComEA
MNSSPSNPPPKPNWLVAWSAPVLFASGVFVGSFAVLLAVWVIAGSRWATRPTVLEPGPRSQIDINHADRAQLLQLPGVGPALAQRIENDFQEHGPYADLNDLTRVPGIGPATAERLRPWIRVADAPEKSAATPVKAKTKSKKSPPSSPINVNQATEAQLQMLPGVGPSLARRIIEAREKAPFETVEDLRRVPGIGAKTLERLRPYIEIGKSPLIANRDSRTL